MLYKSTKWLLLFHLMAHQLVILEVQKRKTSYFGRFGGMQGAERAKYFLWGCQGEVQKGIFKSLNGSCLF